jgi:TrmH family RNA methyltransferase
VITSTRHPLVQAFRRAAAHPRRDAGRRVLLDGPRLVADALDAGVVIDAALVEPTAAHRRFRELVARLRSSGAKVHEAASHVVQAACGVVTSPGLVALAARPAPAEDTVLGAADLVLLVADGIQDPGNLGTMIRTAVAAGATAVALTGEVADPWLPKALRASMGAAFRIPILRTGAAPLCDRLTACGVRVCVADARAGLVYTEADLTPPVAVVIGSEAAGPDVLWAEGGVPVRIPLHGPVESLNAAVAAAVLLYEIARRRTLGSAAP